jgi:hypothetical protein
MFTMHSSYNILDRVFCIPMPDETSPSYTIQTTVQPPDSNVYRPQMP